MALLSSVAGLINSFNQGPLTVTRRGPPTRNAYGEFVEGAGVAVVLNPVAVHVASSRSRENLPEAIRNRETIEVYTRGQRMYVGNDGYASDVIAYQGRNYVVSFVDDYLLNGGVYMALAVLEDTTQP
jgi:hypothetical protein